MTSPGSFFFFFFLPWGHRHQAMTFALMGFGRQCVWTWRLRFLHLYGIEQPESKMRGRILTGNFRRTSDNKVAVKEVILP